MHEQLHLTLMAGFDLIPYHLLGPKVVASLLRLTTPHTFLIPFCVAVVYSGL